MRPAHQEGEPRKGLPGKRPQMIEFPREKGLKGTNDPTKPWDLGWKPTNPWGSGSRNHDLEEITMERECPMHFRSSPKSKKDL